MAHKSRLAGMVIDCKTADIRDAAAFWSGALGLACAIDAEDARYAVLSTPEGEPKMLLQAVEHDSRVHLDIETDDKEAEAARLEALGAKRIAVVKRWTVMEAPSGHRFCVVNPQRGDFADNANDWTF